MNKQMNVRDIAGLCPEVAVWKMLADVGSLLQSEARGYVLSPDTIGVDGEAFMLEGGEEPSAAFLAPEQQAGEEPTEAQMVWALGATAYFAATGHVVFGGHGGSYQRRHPQVPLPALPKAYQALTPLVRQCLCCQPSERISLPELTEQARKGLYACMQKPRTKATTATKPAETAEEAAQPWPEEMKEL